MKKLSMRLDELVVDSFEVQPTGGEVHAYMDTETCPKTGGELTCHRVCWTTWQVI
jgi:hypothetical protein